MEQPRCYASTPQALGSSPGVVSYIRITTDVSVNAGIIGTNADLEHEENNLFYKLRKGLKIAS